MILLKDINLENEIKKNINTIRSIKPSNDGAFHDRYGISFEKCIVDILNSNSILSNKILKELKLNKSDIQNIIYGQELSKYTNNRKIDILIIAKNKNIGISCKTSNTQYVGVLETTTTLFNKNLKEFSQIKNVKIPNTIYLFFEKFEEYNYSVNNIKKFEPKLYQKFLKEIPNYWSVLLEYCIKGKYFTDKNQIDYIFFYDKTNNKTNFHNLKLGIYSLNEYLYLIKKYGRNATFNTKMAITYTSGKSKRLKFKMQNPNRLKR